METTSHLIRMAEELKCPICLSLLKSAVSLTCNHIFCNVCIEKSMKSDSTCPVCKVPYRRREVRPAPHMDTLVSIYKSMEVSSGVNILVTQTEPQTAGIENQVEDESVSRSKKTKKVCKDTPNTHNHTTNKRKALKGSSKRAKRCNSEPERLSFTTKKRIQVPLHHPQETPTRPPNRECDRSELIKDRTQSNVPGPEDGAHLHETGEALFSPFFWHRDEEDSEKPTQLTPFENISPPDAPCFSDLMGSDDDNPREIASKDANNIDSEMFEWTQRPCSPELCASPVKMQDNVSDGYDEVQEKGHVMENHDNMTTEMETDKLEVVLPMLSPCRTEKVNHAAEVKGSRKRTKKTAENTQKKRVKSGTDEVVGIDILPLKADQDKGSSTSKLVKCKKQNSKRGKKVLVDTSSTKALISKVTTNLDEEGSKHGDASTVGLSDKNDKESTNQQHRKRVKRSKTQDPSKTINNIRINNEFISQLPNKPSSADGEIKDRTSIKPTKKGQVSKEPKTSKKVTFSTNKSLKAKTVNDRATPSENVATKASQPLEEIHCSSKKESIPTGKLNSTAPFLRKCNTMSSMLCAFCQSTEESDISGCIMQISGCMTHYLKGKPIALDHEGVASVIHVHRNCTEWAPNVYFEDDIAVNLEAELARSKRIKCSCCGLKGAALGCYEKSCHRSFHFTCAKLTPQCRWDEDNFVMLCPLHASRKLPNETCSSQEKEKKKSVPKRQAPIKQTQVPAADSISAISRWDSHGLFAKVVLCCSALTSTEKETIAKFEKLSGVTILKTWDSRVTHVIASVDENGACRRTLKYLMGVIEGKWILNIEWIKACLEVKKPVDEQLYEINLDIHGFKGGPKLGRSRLLNKEPKLFNGLKFYFTGDFVASYKGYLHDLIIAAGGIVLHRKPIPINNEQQFLIYNLELPDKLKANKQNLVLSQRKSDAEALAKSCGAVAVSNSWILNSIAACKLQNL